MRSPPGSVNGLLFRLGELVFVLVNSGCAGPQEPGQAMVPQSVLAPVVPLILLISPVGPAVVLVLPVHVWGEIVKAGWRDVGWHRPACPGHTGALAAPALAAVFAAILPLEELARSGATPPC